MPLPIHYQSCRQGVWSDCWLLSALVGLAFKRPDELARRIEDLGSGSYCVRFPGRDPILATADQGSPGTTSEPWPWAQVVEAALGQIMDCQQPRVASFGIGIELVSGNG